jgi:cell division protein FtsZ
MSYRFVPTTQLKSIIKVIGVGGGGNNAVNHMYNRGIKDVEFIVCNTDAQALSGSPVPVKLQIGADLTEGLGAGANPEKGREAAIESKEQIREMLSNNTKMVFITAGMGGGTGTGAAPVIAQIARDLGVLTVGIVTAPFSFEGKRKIDQAFKGIEELRKYCDTVLVISNDKLREIYGNMTMSQAYAQADNILATAAKSIAELITVQAYVNVDFEDVKTVMSNSGSAVMGSAKAEGEDRALKAVEEALASPLLNSRDIKGAKKILLSVMSGDKAELQMDEFGEITEYVRSRAGDDADFIYGNGIDPSLGEAVRVTVIATGFSTADSLPQVEKKIVYDTEGNILEVKKQENTENIQEVSREILLESKAILHTPNFTSPENKPQTKVEEQKKIYFQLDEVQEETPATEEVKNIVEEEKPISELELKKLKLQQQAEERKKALKQISTSYNQGDDDIKEKTEVPAYLRKNIELKDVPHSSEKKVSRYNLNDENQILGNNKFFHDKPD